MSERSPADELAQIVIRGLAKGKVIEIDGLGLFYPGAVHGCRFEARPPQGFLAYVQEDRGAAERICQALESAGFSAWLDVRKLLPGQNWPRAIENAIEASAF